MDAGQLDRLAKLQQLRVAGALTDAEFETQKRAVLAPARSRLGWGLAGAGVCGGAAVVAAIVIRHPAEPAPSPAPPPRPATVVSAPVTPTDPPRPPAERLADAFAAVTGHRHAFTQTVDSDTVTTRPLRLLDLPFAPVLLVAREIKDGCHGCAGAIGIYYLRHAGDRMVVTARYPEAVKGWGYGALPDWHLTTRFTANPAIVASGSFTGQGITESGATITELAPTGPATSDVINTGFTDDGAVPDDDPAGACDVAGRIVDVRPDRSFDVAIAGAVSGRDRYRKQGGRFVARHAIDWGMPCGPRAAPTGSAPSG